VGDMPSALPPPSSAMIADARRYGRERDINPFSALLEEVRRTSGNIVFLEGKVNEAPTDDAMLDTHLMWLKLYNGERDRLVKVSETAVRLGLEERVVKVEEVKAELMARAFVAALEELGLPRETLERAPAALRRQLTALEASSSGG
jgi:hypothetical protein